MISLGRSLIAAMNGKNITVRRSSTAGEYVDGVFEPEATTTVVIFGSIQPLSGKELVRLAEGDRTRQRLKVYSADRSLTSRDIVLTEADVLIIDGEDFQVEVVEKWPDYYKLQVVKLNITGEEA